MGQQIEPQLTSFSNSSTGTIASIGSSKQFCVVWWGLHSQLHDLFEWVVALFMLSSSYISPTPHWWISMLFSFIAVMKSLKQNFHFINLVWSNQKTCSEVIFLFHSNIFILYNESFSVPLLNKIKLTHFSLSRKENITKRSKVFHLILKAV